MTLFSCQDTRSRKPQNKEQYPPQKLFEGTQLLAAQKIFNEDDAGLENILKEHPEIIDQLSSIKGYTLLMYSSIIENLNAMNILLQKGADPNIIIPYLNDSPFSHAVATNNYDMLKLLIKYKATLNPTVGSSPLCDAMMLGGADTERKMIDFLLEHGADINHISYLGSNIMETAAMDYTQTTEYLLNKGGNPLIKGTTLSPMAIYIDWEVTQREKLNKPEQVYINLKKLLQEKYNITFPVKKDFKAEAKLRIELYENLSEKDKRSVNFNKNYGENRYKADQLILAE